MNPSTLDHPLPQKQKINLKIVATMLGTFAAVLVVLWMTYENFDHFFTRLDPNNATTNCLQNEKIEFLCDFATVYYPQGRQMLQNVQIVDGFFYSPFFAICMKAMARLPYEVARGIWLCVVAGASLLLLLTPLYLGWIRTVRIGFFYSLIFSLSLPVLHDLSFGQVSSILTMMIMGSFVTYKKGKTKLSASLLALATAIKFYPILFTIAYIARKDLRWLRWYFISVATLLFIFPLAVLGPTNYFVFTTTLYKNIAWFTHAVSTWPYSNFSANALSYAFFHRIDPSVFTYKIVMVITLSLAVTLMFGVVRSVRRNDWYRGMILCFLLIPFTVKTSWVNYFVFLPMAQLYVFEKSSLIPGNRERWMVYVQVGISTILCNFILFLLFSNPDVYYRSALPFWSVLALLVACSIQRYTQPKSSVIVNE